MEMNFTLGISFKDKPFSKVFVMKLLQNTFTSSFTISLDQGGVFQSQLNPSWFLTISLISLFTVLFKLNYLNPFNLSSFISLA